MKNNFFSVEMLVIAFLYATVFQEWDTQKNNLVHSNIKNIKWLEMKIHWSVLAYDPD